MSLVYTSKVDLPNYMWTSAIRDIANLDVELMMHRECSYDTGVCFADKVLVPERLVIKTPGDYLYLRRNLLFV